MNDTADRQESQPEAFASPGRRLAGAVLEIALFCLTLAIGWIVWYLIVARRGQSPAKRLLGMRVVREDGAAADLGWMLVRDLVVRVVALGAVDAGLVGILGETAGGALSGLVVVAAALWCVWDARHRCLWDRVVGTRVIRVARRA